MNEPSEQEAPAAGLQADVDVDAEGANTRANTNADTDSDLSRAARRVTHHAASAHDQDASRAHSSRKTTRGSRSFGGGGGSGRSSCSPPIAALGPCQPLLISAQLETDYLTHMEDSKLDDLRLHVPSVMMLQAVDFSNVELQLADLAWTEFESPVPVLKPPLEFTDTNCVPGIVTVSSGSGSAGLGSFASRPPPPQQRQPADQNISSMVAAMEYAHRGSESLTTLANVHEPFTYYPNGAGVGPHAAPHGAVLLINVDEIDEDLPEIEQLEEPADLQQ
ncbi:hypothetical protein AMAG_00061 [Allomyces macrogynus ATCC 38327]|uniref:Uncharacterized protein n=1 Tax=Allomyces macrogynus (strain ATCC 38327) TaxID=578462 RepID=A0A0L0RVF8_ALLM3|nr:hypothetical protein AMAG_00061 [Allomyces macrogynus ATCC 38327]|eukprot:KNE54060.1 hypothetical protein AMAG_00061 [Allomyces macrogynus ATCC 38327]